jgi:predicted lipid-binding transport protein (Tim44 family)
MWAIRTSVGALVVAALAFGPGACADDDPTSASGDGTTTEVVDRPGDQARDRDRDRIRIHEAVEDVLGACQDQDRDRLRDRTGDRDRDRLRDGSCDAVADGSDVSVTEEDIAIEGDEATVTLRLRVRSRDGEVYELGDTWRFRRSDESGWVLSELPATVDSSEASPTTL